MIRKLPYENIKICDEIQPKIWGASGKLQNTKHNNKGTKNKT